MNNNIKWTNVLYQQTIDYLENGNIPPFRKDKLERFIIRSNKINVEDNKLYYYNKEIIKIDDINNVLHRLYTNPFPHLSRFYGSKGIKIIYNKMILYMCNNM